MISKIKKKFNQEMSNKRLKATGELLKSVNQILSNYASENKISLIIQKKNYSWSIFFRCY